MRLVVQRRAIRRIVAAIVVLVVGLVSGVVAPAFAYQVNTVANTGTGVTTGMTFPSGLTATYTTSGNTSSINRNSSLSGRGGLVAMYTPGVSTSAAMPDFFVDATGCAANGVCANRGTVTVAFNRPVRNPIFHFSGIGGGSTGGEPNNSIIHARGTITGSAPAGATFGAVSGGAVNLTRTNSNTTFDTIGSKPSVNCNANGAAASNFDSRAGCGSMPLAGTYTSVTFTMDIVVAANGTGTAPSGGQGDAFVLGITVPEDFADAPASYNGSPSAAPSHVIGNLQLGAAIDENNAANANFTTTADTVAAGADATAGGDGADEDGWPGSASQLTTALIGSAYNVTVPISGATAAGRVCGWIDFNRGGTFDNTAERSCASFAAGATSVPLSWTVPTGATSAGATYLRLRASYNTTQAESPTGRADSGEVEDYSISIMPVIRVNKAVTNGSTRTFDLAVNDTTVAPGVSNGGTSGLKTVFHTSTLGVPDLTVASDVGTAVVPLTITEAVAGGSTAPYSSSYTCVNGVGTTVVSGTGTSITTQFPASTGTNGQDQNITCTFTNTPTPRLSLTKSVGSVADTNGDGRRSAGDIVTYQFAVTNTGDIAVSSVAITDPAATGLSCPSTSLAPGASTTCAGTHALTQTEVNAGVLNNTATATASSVTGPVTSPASSTSVSIPVQGGVALAKNVASVTDVNSNGIRDAGDRINWTFTVTNASNVTLTSVTVADPLAGSITCPTTTLAPGASTTCTAAPYVISQAQGDAGVVTNTATVSGTTPGGSTLTSPSSTTTTTLTRQAVITTTKSAAVTDVNGNGVTDLGDRITWTFQVSNAGNVTLTTVGVNDPLAGLITCAATTLAPGASTTCAAATPYTITQPDVDAAVVSNTGTASGQSPSGSVVTATGSRSVPVQQTSALSLTKSAAVTDVNGNGVTDLGDRITWTFLARNTGTATLTALAVTDPKAGAVSCPTTTLAPGTQTTCTATTPYVITQTDVNAGIVSNSATASARNPGNVTIPSNASTTDTPVVQVNGLALVKTGLVNDLDNNGTELGDTVTYSFRLTNSGTVTLTSLAVTDPLVPSVSCPTTTLAPGASVTCTGTYTITQANVDAGVVNNTATATGRNPSGATVTSNTSTESIPVAQVASLQLGKVPAVTDLDGNGTDLGDQIVWTFTVLNTGTVTVNSLAVNDPLAGTVTCSNGALPPGVSRTCTMATPYLITQANVNAGQVVNTATASGARSGNTVTSPPRSSTTPIPRSSALTLTKTAAVTDVNGDVETDLGDRITWTFVVRNTGTTTVTGIAVTDPRAGAVTCPTTTLAPGASMTCTAAVYTINQFDVEAAIVSNTAFASGTSPTGAVTSPTSATDTPVVQDPRLTMTKTPSTTDANGNGVTDLGDEITWIFVVTNAGTVSLSNLVVNDPLAGTVSCPLTTLLLGQSTTCTSTTPYVITQANVDAGRVFNTATAAGRGPAGGTITSSPPSTSTTSVPRFPSMTLVKTAAITDVDANGTDLGDLISWDFTVTNTGNTTISNATVTDPFAGLVSCAATTLAPGASTTCTAAPYAITQSDFDAGRVINTANAAGETLGGGSVNALPATVTTPLTQNLDLRLTKSVASVADVNSTGVTDLGDRITWTFLVRNAGNVTISSVAVSDPLAGVVNCPVAVLAPGAQTTCTAAPYAITQEDVDAGIVSNTAQVSAQDPQGDVVASPPSRTDTPVTQSTGLTLTKAAAVNDVDSNGTDLGDTIGWTFTIRNTGTVTLTAITVDDPRAGAITCAATTLAPNATTTCTAAPYAITQADVDAGVVANTATASGQAPGGGTASSLPASTTTPVLQTRGLLLTKSASPIDRDGNGAIQLNDQIAWSFVVRNTGTVTLALIGISDPLAGAVSCQAATLEPNTQITCSATVPYTITQDDVDAGIVSNSAAASARDPQNGSVISNTASADTSIARGVFMSIIKTATVNDVDGNGTDLGDTISYSFQVINTGTVTLNTVTVNDPLAGAVICPFTTLPPGQTRICTAVNPFVITQPSVDAGQVINTARASARDPQNQPVSSSTDSTITAIPRTAALDLTKAVVSITGDNPAPSVGDFITWTFTVRNTGNTTITGVTVNDPLAGTVTCPTTTLAPGDTTTCTADPHAVTQAEMNAGVVANTASAQGAAPTGPVTSSPSSTNTPTNQVAVLAMTKSAAVTDVNSNGETDLNDTIQWTFLVTNPGTVTLSSIAINDVIATGITCTATTVDPEQSTLCTAAPYSITQQDVDNGLISNTATASGRRPPSGGFVISDPSTTDTPITQRPEIRLTKTSAVIDSDSNGTDLGDEISWTFEVTNRGTVTLYQVAVDDPLIGPVTCAANTLSPGDTTTCTADSPYTITQGDVDTGEVVNTATAVGRSQDGPQTRSDEATERTPIPQNPALVLEKTATTDDLSGDGVSPALGDQISWGFRVRNTGNVTLTGLAVNDPIAGVVTCTDTTLPIGASITCTAPPRTISQVDVDAGVVSNTALASANDPRGSPVPSEQAQTDTVIVQSSGLELTKTGTRVDLDGNGGDVGDRIDWEFQVTNSGTVTITELFVDDPLVGVVTCAATTLAPQAATSCAPVTPYVMTQSDVDTGVVANTANAGGELPSGEEVFSLPASASVFAGGVVQANATKVGTVVDVDGDGTTGLGDRINWSFTLTNEGTVTLINIAANDPQAGVVTCNRRSVPPGEQALCTGSVPWVIDQADVDRGEVPNSASIEYDIPSGGSGETTPSTSVPVAQSPGLATTKTASTVDTNTDGQFAAGDYMVWSFEVTNTGTTTISAPAINDPLAGPVTCPPGDLSPGNTVTCTTNDPYVITQDDVDLGVVANTATATGADTNGDPVESAPSTTETPLNQSSVLELVKVATPIDATSNGTTDLGDTIEYTFQLRNSGTVTLSDLAVTDPLAGAISCPATVLAPGEEVTCAADNLYVITQADVDAGLVANVATASATNPRNEAVMAPESSTDTAVNQRAQLAISKNATVTDVDGDGGTSLSDTIAYTFDVTNRGTVTLDTVTVNDPLIGAVTCAATVLAPNATTVCESTTPYVVTQDDVDAGVVTNTATVSGLTPADEPVFSDQSSVATPVPQTAGIEITKTADVTDVNGNGIIDLGDTIQWTVEVVNTGTTTFIRYDVDDPTVGTLNCPRRTILPGEGRTCVPAPYVITQADVDAGVVVNTATAGARTSLGNITAEPSSTETPITQLAGLSIVKSAAVDDTDTNGTDLGDTVAYSFEVTNTGTLTMYEVAVDDPAAGVVSCPVNTLLPGESTTCTADSLYVVTQADVDAGVVTNTATASGEPLAGGQVPSSPSTVNTPIGQSNALVIAKSATGNDPNGDGLNVGETIDYTFTVRNTGTTTVTSVQISDPLAGSVTCAATVLAPGQAATCAADDPFTITQAVLDSAFPQNGLRNTATAFATSPGGTIQAQDSVLTRLRFTPEIRGGKRAAAVDSNGNGVTIDLGDTLLYTFPVENPGNITVPGPITVSDPLVGGATCPAGPLAPGDTMICTANNPYTVTQADVDAGLRFNTMTATTEVAGVMLRTESSSVRAIEQSPSLALAKSAAVNDLNGDGRTNLDDTIDYTFTITNTGTVTASNVQIADPKVGQVFCAETTLVPGESTTCVTSEPYIITQDDMDSQQVRNEATARATLFNGSEVTSAPAEVITPLQIIRGIGLTKLASVNDENGNGVTDEGDTIDWSFDIRNAGDVTVFQVTLEDPLAGPVSCESDGPADLPVGTSVSCTADDSYVITQADVDAGVVVNTATASSPFSGGDDIIMTESTTETPVSQESSLSIVKSALTNDEDGDGTTNLGDTVYYSFVVNNTGTVTVTDVRVDDPMVGAVSCVATVLAPGESTSCTAGNPYAITQVDVENRRVINQATVTAERPNGDAVTSLPATVTTAVDAQLSWELTKSATVNDENGNGVTDRGDTIDWTFQVTNTGTAAVGPMGIDDPMAGSVSCSNAAIPLGESITCAADDLYVITQDDVDAGVVANTASSRDLSGVSGAVSVSSTETAVDQTPRLAIQKTATVNDLDGNSTDLADEVQYQFTVRNTGTVTMSAIAVIDPIIGDVTCSATVLAVGASALCTADNPYIITQADVDFGIVFNAASAIGKDPSGADTISPTSVVDVGIPREEQVSLVKDALVVDRNGDGLTGVGDEVEFTFTVTNTGNTSQTAVAVSDPQIGQVTCAATVLAPDAQSTCTASNPHVITQADVDAGEYVNFATASVRVGRATVTSDPASATTVMDQNPAIDVIKSAAVNDSDGDGTPSLGDQITWYFAVTNTGNLTVTNPIVADPLAGSVTCPAGSVAPAQSVTCQTDTPYVITQADVDAGRIVNTATGSASTPDGGTVESGQATSTTTVGQAPALALVKSAEVVDDGDGETAAGDRIRWTFEVTNTGTTTVEDVQAIDPMAGSITCATTVLAPGAATSCAAEPYIITQADMDARQIVNEAVATGTSGADPVTSLRATRAVPLAGRNALSFTKAAVVNDINDDGLTSLDDTVAYTFTVGNTGTVTVTDITVVDPAVAAVTCAATTLAPGATTTCVANSPRLITQEDVDTGVISNTASPTARAADGTVVTGPASTVETVVDQSRRLILVKKAAPRDRNADDRITAGDDIAWTFQVTNAGTVTVRELRIDDPTAGSIACGATALAPGESTTCQSAERSITVAEGAAGQIQNTATARAQDQQATQVLSSQARAVVKVATAAISRPPTSPTPSSPNPPASGPMWLPRTGGQALGLLVGVASGAITLGGWLVLATRRRRSSGSSGLPRD
ncbi:MAG: DUF7507 domain-containing protein [Actinomycetota bacterium]